MTTTSEKPARTGLCCRIAAPFAGVLERIQRRVRDVRARTAIRSEFARLDSCGELGPMLSDFGLSSSALPEIVKNHPAAPRRLAGMLQRLGVKPTASQQRGAEMRAIERACLQCGAGRQCDHWLRSGTLGQERRFCPNAEAFDRLRAQSR